MKISFQIPYHTRWGEDVRILFSDGMVHPLHTRNGEIWRGSIELDTAASPAELSYQYAIFQDDVCIRKEWNGVKRRLNLNHAYNHLILELISIVPPFQVKKHLIIQQEQKSAIQNQFY